MKKILSVMVTAVLMMSMLYVSEIPVNAAGEVLIVHYNRPDEDYEQWNVWAWAEGKDGSATEFEFEDDFGKVAVIPLPEGTLRAGFIVRTDSWEKDTGSDRFVDLVNGKGEVWVYSGEEAFETSAPAGYASWGSDSVSTGDANAAEENTVPEGDVQIKVHYHRFDQNYDGWNLWIWPEGGDGSAYTFDETDEFGVVMTADIPGSEDVSNLGVIIRLNEWEAKDVEKDRFISTAKVNSDGVLEVYLIQTEERIYYNKDSIDLSPKFLSAEMVSENTIDFSVSIPFALDEAKENFMVTTSDDAQVVIKSIESVEESDLVSSGTIVLEEVLAIGESYQVVGREYEAYPVSMTKVFDFPEFEDRFHYDGDDLGVTYLEEASTFRLWAPTALEAYVLIYDKGIDGNLLSETPMIADISGTYVATVDEDLKGKFYTYKVKVNNDFNEAVDPYAKAVGVNGDRGMIVDLSETNPEGWEEDVRPELDAFTDAIVYELHVRDLSTSDNSGIENKGKYLGLTETGTVNDEGLSTGLDHLKELGITHLQLLPVFDYRTIDETSLENNDFNWGYDPENYNAPEGSYSTDPYNGEVRIKEFKEMVQVLHENDIRVIMDVVYNHTGASQDSHLNLLVPDYYYRTVNGVFSNGSGCGNETASERSMVQKMIVDSVVYWADEYHVDGFRFDLMGLHDTETMTMVRQALDEIDPTIIVYGEGWTGGSTPLAESERLVKSNTSVVEGVGAFSDDLRDGIKGHVFESETPGFVNGHTEMEESVKFGIVGSTLHPQVDYEAVNYSNAPWASTPAESINYAEAHDNLTLWDKLLVTNPDNTKEELEYMDKMSGAIFMTSQGVPFIHAGMEFLRTKDGDHNSYKSSDEINQLDWALKSENMDVFEYYKGLIALRKDHPAFRMDDTEMVVQAIEFYGEGELYHDLQLTEDQMVAYIINNHGNNDESGAILVAFNASSESKDLYVPAGTWKQVVNRDLVDLEGITEITEQKVTINPYESIVLLSDIPVDTGKDASGETMEEVVDNGEETKDSADNKDSVNSLEQNTEMAETNNEESADGQTDSNNALPIALGVLVVGAGAGVVVSRRKRK